jgi:uncharacterized SAM-binding protein YcdF (DUF218 family)
VRSVQSFRKQGIEVVPAPTAFRYIQLEGTWEDFVPSPKMIQKNEDSLHEWMGLAWYKLRGRA